jgi:lipoprotein-releasing system permease protein
VILVAAFSVMNTTITVTVQKRREIGILTALGASVSQILGIFMLQSLVVAVLGTLLGWLGGLTFLHFRNDIRALLAEQLGVDVFPSNIYALSSIPAHTLPEDVGMICGISVVLCLLAAFIPAFFAARVDPAVALRD